MNRIRQLIVVTVALCSFDYVFACVDEIDKFSAGVVFNNYEKFFINRFDSIGTEGVNFNKSCKMIDIDPPVKNILFKPTEGQSSINTDPVSIENVTITNNLLKIGATYGGGCNSHEFNLYVGNEIDKPRVLIAHIELVHDAKGDACKAIVSEDIIFNLEPFEKRYYNSSPMILDIFTRESFDLNKNFEKVIWYPDNTCSITYRSHYSPDNAMVKLEFVTIEGSSNQKFPSLRIVTDPQVVLDQPFNYSEAVITELKWLLNKNIISDITENQLSRIKESLLKNQGQYWTLQDTLMSYNSFFRYVKDTTGNWGWSTAMAGRKNGCSSEIEFKLPADTLGDKRILGVKTRVQNKLTANFSVNLTDRKCTITFENNTKENGFIEIMDLQGRSLEKIRIPRQTIKSTFRLSKVSGGMYNLVYTASGVRQISRIMIVE